jgi:hypothetical protein
MGKRMQQASSRGSSENHSNSLKKSKSVCKKEQNFKEQFIKPSRTFTSSLSDYRETDQKNETENVDGPFGMDCLTALTNEHGINMSLNLPKLKIPSHFMSIGNLFGSDQTQNDHNLSPSLVCAQVDDSQCQCESRF